jgi:hypothetical protein
MLGRIAEDEFTALTAMHQQIARELESGAMSDESKTFLRGVSSSILDVVANNKVLDRMERQSSYESDPAWGMGYHEGVSMVVSIVNKMRKRRKIPAQGPNTLGNYGMYAK